MKIGKYVVWLLALSASISGTWLALVVGDGLWGAFFLTWAALCSVAIIAMALTEEPS